MAFNLARNNLHWNYFLALEADVVRISRFIELDEGNMGVFSIELARVLLTACTNFEVIGKLIARACAVEARGMEKIHSALMKNYPEVAIAEVSLPRYGLTRVPLAAWSEKKGTPLWWTAYNDLKHGNAGMLSHATLNHCIESVGALMLLVLLYSRLSGVSALMPAPELFVPQESYGKVGMMPAGRIISLP